MTTRELTVPKRTGLIDLLIPRNQGGSLPAPTDDFWYGPVGRPKAGQNVNGQTALTFSGCWAATNAIAGLFGQLPCKAYKKTDDGREEATKHDVHRVVSREPNPEMDSFTFWEMMTQWWVNWGNAFAEIQRLEDSDRLYALWPIHPSRVKPERTNDGIWTGFWIVDNKNQPPSRLPAPEVLNIVGALSDDGLIGKGVLKYAAQSIGVGLAENEYKGDFYGNGGRPSGVLEHPKSLSEKARADIRRDWKEVHAKGNELAVLWEGMKYSTIGVDPDHAKLLDSQLFSVQEMSRFYDLPPHVLYELSKGTFANVEEMNRFLVSHSFGKRLVRTEKALDRQLFTESEKKAGYYTKFNVDALLRGNPKEQAEIAAIHIGAGIKNQDEVRAHLDLNKLPDKLGQTYWVRRDMAPVDLAIKSAEKALATPSPDIGPTPPTPGTPDTPPVPGETKAKLRRLSKKLRNVSNELKERDSTIKALEATATSLESARVALESEKMVAEQRIADLDAQSSGQIASISDLRSKLESITAEAKSHDELAQQFASALSEETGKLTEANARAEAIEQQRADAVSKLEDARAQLKSAQNDHEATKIELSEAQNELSTLKTGLSDAERLRDEAVEKYVDLSNRYEALMDKSAASDAEADRQKSRCDDLATDVGSLRAERDTLRAQVDTLTAARESDAQSLLEARNEAKTANSEAAASRRAAIEAKQASESHLSGCRRAVAASFRALLGESLNALLDNEQHEVRTAARKPEQFKAIVANYYHHFQERLVSQLEKAADALEKMGYERTDVAKTASKYVSDSRTKLNNVYHTTNRDDLRVKVREETELWEGRKQTLLDWIGG